MSHKMNSDTWVWVVVQESGGNEQFLGQHDQETNVSFIPVFSHKEDAQQCLIHMKTAKGKKYEVQAVLYDELIKDAANSNFMIFMLNGEGEILEKINPSTQPG